MKRAAAHGLLPAALALLLAGCASMPRWPSADEWKAAAVDAARDPDSWAPAAGAVAIAVTGTDHDISDWARDNTPVFGSTGRADQASDTLKLTAHVLMLGSAASIEAGSGPWRKRVGTIVEDELIVLGVEGVTGALKVATSRERPDGSDEWSFPSGHASGSSAYAALTRENLQTSVLTGGWRRSLSVASRVASVATAWARVEAGVHYPTDVLAGAALGNYLAVFLHRAFGAQEGVTVEPAVSRDGWSVNVAIRR